MTKSTVTHIFVMLIALAISSYLANTLVHEEAYIAKSRSSMAKTPVCGFNKFISDVQWMRFVNYCGSVKQVSSENVETVYKKLNEILRNDPDFDKAYHIGGLMLSCAAPVKSVEIFMRGSKNPNIKHDWKLPFLAGFVLTQNVKDGDNLDILKPYIKEGTPMDRHILADMMFRKSLANGGSGQQVVSLFLRNRAAMIENRGRWKGIKILNNEHAYLCACFDEWKKTRQHRIDDESNSLIGSSDDLKKRLLATVRELKRSYPDNKLIMRTIRIITKTALSGKHLCPECLTEYPAGAKYCSNCGHKVKPYGICPKCGSVVSGDYCSKCGTKVKSSKK